MHPCRARSPRRGWLSTAPTRRYSAARCAAPASTPSGRTNTAPRHGPCWKVRSVRSAEAADRQRSKAFGLLDRFLAQVTEIPAAILVAVEILVLLAGVISRYVFNRPLTWSDELASILFLWLAMLGAVIALRRAEHMRLGFLVSRAPPRLRGFVDTLATTVVLVFLLAIIWPALDYAGSQQMITTPALEIP